MKELHIDDILAGMLGSHDDVSDLNISVGRPLQVESSGRLAPASIIPEIEALTPFQAEMIALRLMGDDRRLLEMLLKDGSCDFSYQLRNEARFRVNIFAQRLGYSCVLRKLSTHIPTLKDMELPDVFEKIHRERNGIVLITGATGSGKSTTLAALLNEINESRAVHAVTLEDPIEFVHPHKKSTINQREMGMHFDTFAGGLRAALRQAPKVIMVGEMRDRETMEIGLSAAETGHLVFSTLHTVDAGQTINRIIGMFDKDEEKQIRIRLADTVRWICCQKLLPDVKGGRTAVFEIMGSDIRTRELVLNGESEDKTFYGIIESKHHEGWQTFDQSILNRYRDGLLEEETAEAYSTRKPNMKRLISDIKRERKESELSSGGLKMED